MNVRAGSLSIQPALGTAEGAGSHRTISVIPHRKEKPSLYVLFFFTHMDIKYNFNCFNGRKVQFPEELPRAGKVALRQNKPHTIKMPLRGRGITEEPLRGRDGLPVVSIA